MLYTVKSYVKRRWMRIYGEFPRLWRHYIYQSLLAAVVIFIVLLLLTIEHAVVIASIGASAFIIFTMPRNITAKPRRLIGGHIIGLVTGSLCALVPNGSTLVGIGMLALAVGISIFLMVALDFEHPPAAGTALGVAITGFSVNVMIAIVTSVLILALTHHFSKRFLKDLT